MNSKSFPTQKEVYKNVKLETRNSNRHLEELTSKELSQEDGNLTPFESFEKDYNNSRLYIRESELEMNYLD